MLIHKSKKDDGNIGPSIHLLHGKTFRDYPHGITLVGISRNWSGDGFEIVLFLYWWRIYLYMRSRTCWLRCKEGGDSRVFIGEIIDLQESCRAKIKFYKEHPELVALLEGPETDKKVLNALR